jgi:hypothetical protein
VTNPRIGFPAASTTIPWIRPSGFADRLNAQADPSPATSALASPDNSINPTGKSARTMYMPAGSEGNANAPIASVCAEYDWPYIPIACTVTPASGLLSTRSSNPDPFGAYNTTPNRSSNRL